ncbi:MAG: hypothetical protein NC253_08455 [Ruminococcus sp.]|nr:hypothetical protein [Ruminococcus sp.]
MEIISTIASYCGSISAIIALVVLIIKPLRKKFIEWIAKTSDKTLINDKIDNLTKLVQKQVEQNETQQKELDKQSEALMCSLRTNILSVYYKYYLADKIPLFTKECFAKSCETYFNMNGNSFVRQCYEEIMKKPTE